MTMTVDFQGQIKKKKKRCISEMGWQIDMERKGCESI